jgi:mannosyltransferase
MLGEARSGRMGWGLRLTLMAVILLAAGLRLHQLGADSLWYDEIIQVSSAAKYTASEIIQVHLPNAAAPLDPLITNVMLYLGRNEYLLRFPAACFSVLTVALCFALGRDLFGPTEGLIAAFLLAISWFHVRYAQEVRAYALLAFLGSLSLWFLWRALRHDKTLDWLAWTVTGPLGLLAHPFAAFWVLAQALYGITSLAFGALFKSKASVHRLQLKKLLLGASLTGIGAGVQFALAAADYSKRVPMKSNSASAIIARWIAVTRDLLLKFSNDVPMYWLCIGAILCVCLFSVRQRQHRPAIWLLTLSCVVPWLLVLVIIVGRRTFYVRYVLFMLPPYLLLVARGVRGVIDVAVAWIGRITGRRLAVTAWAFVLSAATFGTASLEPVRVYYASAKPDWRGVAQLLAENTRPADVILTDEVSPNANEGRALRCLSYYFPSETRNVLLLPVSGIEACEEIRDTEAQVGAVVYHPIVHQHRGLPKMDLAPLQVVRFRKVTVLWPEGTDRVLDGALRALQALLLMQQEPVGEFDVHLSLARVYAMGGEFSLAHNELQAARSLSLQSEQAEMGLIHTAEYVREREERQ